MVNDILTDIDTDDLLIKNGDFVIGESNEQNLEDLVYGAMFDYKLAPLIGAGGRELRNIRNETFEAFESRVKNNLVLDAWEEDTVKIESAGKLTVIANKL